MIQRRLAPTLCLQDGAFITFTYAFLAGYPLIRAMTCFLNSHPEKSTKDSTDTPEVVAQMVNANSTLQNSDSDHTAKVSAMRATGQ